LVRTKASPGRVAVLPRRKQGNFSMYKLAVTGGLILIGLFLAVISFQSIQRHQLQQEMLQYQARIEEHEARNLLAGNEIERLHELGYIELLARKYLGLVKPGETIFQFED
jgi:cell division protein FtsB